MIVIQDRFIGRQRSKWGLLHEILWIWTSVGSAQLKLNPHKRNIYEDRFNVEGFIWLTQYSCWFVTNSLFTSHDALVKNRFYIRIIILSHSLFFPVESSFENNHCPKRDTMGATTARDLVDMQSGSDRVWSRGKYTGLLLFKLTCSRLNYMYAYECGWR